MIDTHCQLAGRATRAQYANLVRHLATGGEPEIGRVLVVLASVGRTAAELAHDVAEYQRQQTEASHDIQRRFDRLH